MSGRTPFGRGRTAGRLLARIIRFAVWLGSRTPPRVAHAAATFGGTIEWALRPGKRRRLAANLSHAVERPASDPVVRRMVRREIVNEAHRSADLLWALGSREEFLATTEFEGIEEAARVADEGRGVILLGTHLGGWEVATAVPGAKFGPPTHVIVREDWLAWGIEHARVAAGLSVLYATNGALAAARVLKRGEIVLMLGDDGRQASHTYPVRFLDGTAQLAGGAVALSRISGAPIITFDVLPLGPRRWRVTAAPAVGPPDPGAGEDGERALLQQLADRFTTSIRANPEHWAAGYQIEWGDDG